MNPPAELTRFAPSSRAVHRATAVLGVVCLATAAALYLEPIAELVGRRNVVVDIHVWSGLALPVPALLGVLARATRADFVLLNRFTRTDRDWLRLRNRRTAGLPVGKFNAGQKLNASLSAGGGLVLLGTGLIMAYGRRSPLNLRIGATFVHDWTAFAFLLLVLGHVWFASHDEDARRGMRTGLVPAGWALREHPAWAAEAGAAASGLPRTTIGDAGIMDPQDAARIRHRADDLLPEELAAGSDDPRAEAAAILADSDEREDHPSANEHRTSADATDPLGRND
ncbi:MAG TPA: cytochrome b/b6 domain-containing protein [Mycobacteriales bacterium]|jgi:formate dehydrogenase subunit gamma|nr:cytochrome b/b6 domain-containing protein [Mycobacteriales bacterium]